MTAEVKISAKGREAILGLGLSYAPAGEGKRQLHAQRLNLLCHDCAQIPPEWLAKACEAWRQRKPYLPKSSELIALAKDIQANATAPLRPDGKGYAYWLALARQRNTANEGAEGNKGNVRWIPRPSGDGMDPITLYELAHEVLRARSLQAEGKDHDRQYLDVLDESDGYLADAIERARRDREERWR